MAWSRPQCSSCGTRSTRPARRSTPQLQLLLAEDARYSSVAGVAPPGTGFVRLHWRNGDVTDVPVADDEVPAFVDTSGHRPDRLTLAQAINTAGDETARAEP